MEQKLIDRGLATMEKAVSELIDTGYVTPAVVTYSMTDVANTQPLPRFYATMEAEKAAAEVVSQIQAGRHPEVTAFGVYGLVVPGEGILHVRGVLRKVTPWSEGVMFAAKLARGVLQDGRADLSIIQGVEHKEFDVGAALLDSIAKGSR